MWAVLTQPERRGRKWTPEEFFAEGRREIDEVLASIAPLGLPAGHGSALDFGCGVGRLTQALAEHFDDVVGIDIAASMLENARRFNDRPNVRFVLNEEPHLAVIPDTSIDFVYTTIVLQHMAPELALGYLEEFARILRPGGVAVFTLPTGPSRTLVGRLYRVVPAPLVHLLKKRLWGAVIDMHGVPMETLLPTLTSAGLRVERIEPDTSPGPNWRGFRYVVAKR
nr:class I SAM-dependent methyltransferase [Petropleomorpha daqingensis]